jgi:hypothetical protein
VSAKNQLAASQLALLTTFLPAFLLSGFLYVESGTAEKVRFPTPRPTTFIGGLIVSLTLLTGDRLREGIKDAESSITSAQQFFRIQMLSEASILGVKTLRQRTQPLIEDSLRRSFAPNTDVTSTLDQFESSK